MAKQIPDFSKKELMDLLNNSLAISMLKGEQRDALNAVLEKASDDQLMQLYGMLMEEKEYKDEMEKGFYKKTSDLVENFSVNAKAEIEKAKKRRVSLAEKKSKSGEEKAASALLKSIKNI
jgi:hypothetical protein